MNSTQVEALLSRRVGVNTEGDPVWIVWREGTAWEPEKDKTLNITVGVGAYQHTTLTAKQARDLAINILDMVGV
jgi:hypothetical protein